MDFTLTLSIGLFWSFRNWATKLASGSPTIVRMEIEYCHTQLLLFFASIRISQVCLRDWRTWSTFLLRCTPTGEQRIEQAKWYHFCCLLAFSASLGGLCPRPGTTPNVKSLRVAIKVSVPSNLQARSFFKYIYAGMHYKSMAIFFFHVEQSVSPKIRS